MYFVVECTTTSAPRAIGCWSTGVANVLSTTVRIPARRAMALHAAMSVTFSSGFDGVSNHSSFVSGRIAFSTAVTSLLSTKVKSIPNFAKYLVKMRQAPPYKSCVETT